VLRTFSKLYGMAGARLGLAIGHPQLLARLERFGGHNVVPSPTAHAGLESLRDDDLVPRRKQQNAEVRERTIAWLRQQGFRCTASQSNCFMV
ncbi:aminotransferase class I/II-fold pyridoxal phosphate-dependent enzyme, partial [Escherichia coli]